MSEAEKQALRSAGAGEIKAAVDRVYCPHDLQLRGRDHRAAALEVIRGGELPIVTLRYGSPVRIETDFQGLMLVQTCLEGAAQMMHGGVHTACHRGQTVPLSPGMASELAYDGAFAQRSVRVGIGKLEGLLARRLNAPLNMPLRFEFRPFSAGLELAWSQAVSLMVSYELGGIALPRAAAAHLDEFLLTLLLEQHPHNYSDELLGRASAPAPRLIREAEHLMRTCGADLTASKIAARLRVSLRSLETGFQEWRRQTPTQVLRQIRLESVRGELLAPKTGTTVTSAALGQGFFHLPRFSAHYKSMFGELPAQTLRRASLK